MTAQQLVDAILGLGVTIQPHPSNEQDCQYQSPDDPGRQDRSSVTLQEGVLLSEWASGHRVMEIGTGLGVSTVALAHHADFVHTIDPSEWVRSALTMPQNVRQWASVEDVPGTFGRIFIDGLHDFASVCKDIESALLMLSPEGQVAFHDMCQSDVRAAVDSFDWKDRIEYPTVGLLTFCMVKA